jgi:hypothetical protein
MIVCSAILLLCNCLFRDIWSLCLKSTKIFFSKKKIWSQRTSLFVFCCSSLFDWSFDSLLTQTWCFSLSLFSRAKSIWKIICHFIYFFHRLLSCIKTIKRNVFFVIDVFSSFDQRIENAFVMKTRRSCAASIVFAQSIYMFVTLTIKTLLQFVIFVKIFACSMRIFIE